MWSGLGLQTGYHYLIDMYNMNEKRILAWSNQQNKMELIYETTDKQKKEFQRYLSDNNSSTNIMKGQEFAKLREVPLARNETW